MILLSSSVFSQNISRIFEKYNITGTIVVADSSLQHFVYSDKNRANKRYSPASTFKILNSLILLNEKAIADENEIIKWDGKKRFYNKWNKDQSLKTALPISCVWFYQRLSPKIGKDKYLIYLNDIDYGNAMISNKIKTFWLDGSLRISAKEQIKFLRNFYEEKIPFSHNHINVVKDLLSNNYSHTTKIFAKTGWSISGKTAIGWYIGYVLINNKPTYFALNIDIKNNDDAKYRKIITTEVLKELNILTK